MSEQKFYITPTGNEITIREGQATAQLPLKEPQIINVSGDIKTISNFLEIRKENAHSSQVLDANKIIVTVDKTARTITMELDPENHYGATINGKLYSAPELAAFQINSGTFSREGFLKVVRFNKLWFNDKELHSKLVQNLSNITIKTEAELQQANDRQGNKNNSYDQKAKVPDTWIRTFDLLIPIFKGFEPVKINMEICFEVTPSGFSFWLESPELVEFTEAQLDKIFEDALTECSSYVTIYK